MASGVMPQHDGHFEQSYLHYNASSVKNECDKLNPDVGGVSDAVSEDEAVDIIISNVVCTFNTKCHLHLKRIAQEGMNVVYKREQGMVSMKVRNPNVTASIWSSGKVTCTGAQSEEEAKVAGRKVARCLQNLGFKVRFTNFRVVNVLGTCSLPFGIRVNLFSRDHPGVASYEPELHPGVTYRLPSPKACLKIFSTGSITVTAPRIANVQAAIEHIYPLVQQHQMPKSTASSSNARNNRGGGSNRASAAPSYPKQSFPKRRQAQRRFNDYDVDDDDFINDDDDEEDDDNDVDYS